jgi:hypothetical protein
MYTCKKQNTMSKNSPEGTGKQKEVMLRALEAHYGNIVKAAKVAGITSQTHYRWLKEDKGYDLLAKSIKDVCYRDLKEDLIENGLKMIEKGNAAVLIKMLGIFLKDLPEEMKMLNRMNNTYREYKEL